MKKVFVTVFGKTKKELLEMIKISRDFTKNFELRFDLCGSWKFDEKNLRALFPQKSQVIFTNRGDENFAGFANFELIDSDLDQTSPKLTADKTLLSCHLFGEFSREKTAQTIEKLQKNPAKFYKLAVNLENFDDLCEFYNLSKNLDQKKWILAGMGDMGKISRGIFAKEGFWTFAGIKNKEVATGQIDLETLYNLIK